MEKVFNGVSEKTRAERWDERKSGFKERGRQYREVKVEVKNEKEAKTETWDVKLEEGENSERIGEIRVKEEERIDS